MIVTYRLYGYYGDLIKLKMTESIHMGIGVSVYTLYFS